MKRTDKIPLTIPSVQAAMAEELDRRQIRYHPEFLEAYVKYRLPVARKGRSNTRRNNQKETITMGSVCETWVGGFLEKYG